MLRSKHQTVGLKLYNDPKKYSNDLDNIYEKFEEYNGNKKRKILIAFDDMVAGMPSNKIIQKLVT